jgi:predicted kinase
MRPYLIMVTGLPGCGKTTFARALAEDLHAVHLNTDRLRDEMGLRGQYDEQSKQKVYARLREEATRLLAEQRCVIVDGTFYKQSLRQPYIELAAAQQAPIIWFQLQADQEAIMERTSKRRQYSEADFAVHQAIAAAWEAFSTPPVFLPSAELSSMIAQAKAQLPL